MAHDLNAPISGRRLVASDITGVDTLTTPRPRKYAGRSIVLNCVFHHLQCHLTHTITLATMNASALSTPTAAPLTFARYSTPSIDRGWGNGRISSA